MKFVQLTFPACPTITHKACVRSYLPTRTCPTYEVISGTGVLTDASRNVARSEGTGTSASTPAPPPAQLVPLHKLGKVTPSSRHFAAICQEGNHHPKHQMSAGCHGTRGPWSCTEPGWCSWDVCHRQGLSHVPHVHTPACPPFLPPAACNSWAPFREKTPQSPIHLKNDNCPLGVC